MPPPYVSHDELAQLGRGMPAETPGQLNRSIPSHLIRSDGKINYSKLNEVDGVLGLAQAEFRRRVVVPYEGSKIQQKRRRSISRTIVKFAEPLKVGR